MPIDFPEWVPPQPPDTTTPDLQSARSVLAAAEGSSIPLGYGRSAFPGSIFALTVSTTTNAGLNLNPGDLVLGLAWCLGEINNIRNIYIGDAVAPSGWVRGNYVGTDTQGVDPVLAAVIAGYSDTLRGTVYGHPVSVAYSVIVVPAGSDFPEDIQADIEGRLTLDVNDPTGPKVYRAFRPAPSIADFLTDPLIGLGAQVDWPSFVDLELYCDGKFGINLAIIERAGIDQWLETLREYANCWLVSENNKIYAVPRDLVPDQDLFWELTDDDIVEGSVDLQQIGNLDLPTIVTVEATDLSAWPHVQRTWKKENSLVSTGEAEHREALLSFNGGMSSAQAERRATQRLNRYNLTHLRMTCTVFDKGVFYRIGDVFKVRHSYGIIGKRMRLVEMDLVTIGRWRFTLEEYDARALDFDVIYTDPTWTDTELLAHSDPPEPTNVTTEAVTIDGQRYVRIAWDIDDSNYIYPYYFRVIYQGSSQVDGAELLGTEFTDEFATELYVASNLLAPADGISRLRTQSTWMGRTVQSDQDSYPWVIPGDPQTPVPPPENVTINWHDQPRQAIIAWEWNRPETWQWPLDGFRISGTTTYIDIDTDDVLSTTPFTLNFAPQTRAWISGAVPANVRIELTATVAAFSGAEESTAPQVSISSEREEADLPAPENLAVAVHVNASGTTPPGIFHVKFSPTYNVSTLAYKYPFDGAGRLTIRSATAPPVSYSVDYPSQVLQSRPPPTYEMIRPIMWGRSTEPGNIWESFGTELEVPGFGTETMEYIVEVWLESGPFGNRYQGPKATLQGLLFPASAPE